MTIRQVTAADYDAVEEMALAMHHDAVAHRPDLYAPREVFYTPELFGGWVNDADAIWLLAEADGKPVGICLTRINEKQGAFKNAREPCVDILYVREAYRHRGIARRLLEETRRRAAAVGLSTLTLFVDGYNAAAQKLYESFGMTPRQICYERTITPLETE